MTPCVLISHLHGCLNFVWVLRRELRESREGAEHFAGRGAEVFFVPVKHVLGCGGEVRDRLVGGAILGWETDLEWNPEAATTLAPPTARIKVAVFPRASLGGEPTK